LAVLQHRAGCEEGAIEAVRISVALQTFLARVPEFRLAEPAAVIWAGGQVRGPRTCLVLFSA